MKETIHFAHANGFPSPCYREMFRHLLDDYDLSYIDTIGHESQYPVTDSWTFLAKELIDNIMRYHTEPVIGVGHSLGGVLNYLAASQRPELFKAIILLDSPVYGGLKSRAIKFMKQFKLINAVSPGRRTIKRRNTWETRQQVYQYLKSKTIFQTFDEQCLNDYIDFGMAHHEQMIQLRFKREIESAIYQTLPHNLVKLKSTVNIPIGLLYGKSSTVIKVHDLKFMQRQLNFKTASVVGDHLFPFQHPKAAALALKNMINDLLK
ncbi:MAG: alpha/beta hydrolase [Legionellales bacterium]|nr:alpha/beta hydrolase [Legionellales bacterium]